MAKEVRSQYYKSAPWVYYLERIYVETKNLEKVTEIVHFILVGRDTSYFAKLKEIYLKQGIWEEQREKLWQELSEALMEQDYAALLSKEAETDKLLALVKQYPSYVPHYGGQLASSYPDETFAIYEKYIQEEAQAATERRKYRQVCRIIKDFAAVGAKTKAVEMIDCLSEIYSHRPAMLEELAELKRRLGK